MQCWAAWLQTVLGRLHGAHWAQTAVPGGEVAASLGDLYAGDVAGLPVPLLIVAAAMLGWVLLERHRLGRQYWR